MMRCGPVSPAPDPALVGRFKAALDRLNPDGGKIGLAVSGGPDSMAMLLLAHAAIPGQFEAATVNHGLRPEAADECALVAQVCAERGIPCAVLKVSVGAGNVQAEAREARYEALGEWAMNRRLRALATAHHIDDQAETLIMRLNRGSGLPGLAGVRPRLLKVDPETGRGFFLIRPLLECRRAELEAVVAQAGVVPVSDPTNADDGFDRVRIRKGLATADWLDPQGVAISAQLLFEAFDALTYVARNEWDKGVTWEEGSWYRYFPYSHPLIEVEVLSRIFGEFGKVVSRAELARLRERLVREKNASLAGVLATAAMVEVEDEAGRIEVVPCWTFRPEPPRRTG